MFLAWIMCLIFAGAVHLIGKPVPPAGILALVAIALFLGWVKNK